MPEWGELQRQTGQRGLLISSYRRLGKIKIKNSCGRGILCPCILGAARVPASQVAVPPSHSTLTGAELPQGEKKNVLHLWVQGCFGHVQHFVNLYTLACQASLSESWFSRQYGSVLANTGCYTLLEHYISCCPSRQLP